MGCAKPYDPFKVPVEQVRAQIETIALPPLSVHPDLVDVERARRLIEPRVVSMLLDAGYDVIPPDEWDRRWLAIAHTVGEIWNPVTGERDDEHYEAAMSALRHDLSVERGVDAIVHLTIAAVRVEASLRSPVLCGRNEDVYWPGGLSRRTRVTVAYGSCLGVTVTDMDERELYSIQQSLEFVDTYARQTHASRPLDERLRDPERVEQAIQATIGPLAEVRSGR